MSLTFDQGKQVLFDTIQKDLTHCDYKRVCELAEMYTTFLTGENIDKLLLRFAPRETPEQFEQRKRITEIITPYIASRVMSPMNKVWRTIAEKSIFWTSDKENTDQNKRDLDEALEEFAGDESLEDYLAHALVNMDSMDPNSFIIIDFEGEVDPNDLNSKAEPYPFEVNSKEAINYQYKNNRLQFLVVLNCIEGMDRYTMYLENQAIIADEITEDDYKEIQAGIVDDEDDSELAIKIKNSSTPAEILFKDPDKKEKGRIFLITSADHNAGKIPAIRIGCKRDPLTRGRTYIPLIHPAKAFFKKSIKTISEFDLTNALHVFPKLIQYDTVCPGDPNRGIMCQGGKIVGNEHEFENGFCPVCKGTGFNEHHSSADVLRVKMPDDLSKIVSLDNFISYKTPPIELIEFMKKLGLYELPDLATKAVYTSEAFTPDTIANSSQPKTATAEVIDLDSVYDVLRPFANKGSNIYKFIVSIVATYIDLGEDLYIEHHFPNDFKMKGVSQLLADLTAANASGAPSYIKKEINRDIAHKLYIDKPEELLMISVKDKFFPFNGKTETEIATIITNGITTKYNEILYANYDTIFDELDQENTTDEVSFWKMETSLQRELLQEKVQEYMDTISGQQAQKSAALFSAAGKITPTDFDNAGTPEDTQDYNPGDAVTYNGEPVEIIDGNPGPDGGTYNIKLSDGSQVTVAGKDMLPTS